MLERRAGGRKERNIWMSRVVVVGKKKFGGFMSQTGISRGQGHEGFCQRFTGYFLLSLLCAVVPLSRSGFLPLLSSCVRACLRLTNAIHKHNTFRRSSLSLSFLFCMLAKDAVVRISNNRHNPDLRSFLQQGMFSSVCTTRTTVPCTMPRDTVTLLPHQRC